VNQQRRKTNDEKKMNKSVQPQIRPNNFQFTIHKQKVKKKEIINSGKLNSPYLDYDLMGELNFMEIISCHLFQFQPSAGL